MDNLPRAVAKRLDRNAVWDEDPDGPREPCIRWGPDPSREGAFLSLGGDRPIGKYCNSEVCNNG